MPRDRGGDRLRPVVLDERFIELDYGDLEGVPVGGRAAVDVGGVAGRHRRGRPPAGESLDDLAARVWPAPRRAAPRRRPTTDIVVVSHVSPIKAAVAWALGVGIEAQWRCFVAQASISRIGARGPVPSLHSFNETHHLP